MRRHQISINSSPRRMCGVFGSDGVGGIAFVAGQFQGFSGVSIAGMGDSRVTFLAAADRIVGVATCLVVSAVGSALVIPQAGNTTAQVLIRDAAGVLVDLTNTVVTVNLIIEVIP